MFERAAAPVISKYNLYLEIPGRHPSGAPSINTRLKYVHVVLATAGRRETLKVSGPTTCSTQRRP